MAKQKKKSKTGLFILLGLLVALAAAGLFILGEINGKPGGEDVVFLVEKGQAPNATAQALEDAGIINNAMLFKVYLKVTGEGPNLQYGSFTIAKRASYKEIVGILKTLNSEARETITITFPEGYTLMQFATAMESAGFCTKEEFIEVTQTADFSDIPFVAALPKDENIFLRLEGYLFPATYEFFAEESVESAVRRMLTHFDEQLSAAGVYTAMEEQGYTLNELIALASIIQEEAGDPVNMVHVASVLTNRLVPGSPCPKLECDVSIRYIRVYMGEYFGGESRVPAAMDAAYDLYNCVGLPAGPICNPGIDAILAALYPIAPRDSVDYFFVTDELGNYYYGATMEEHEINIAHTKRVNATIVK